MTPTTTAIRPQPQSSLLRLPVELRIQIYEYVLAGSKFSYSFDVRTNTYNRKCEDRSGEKPVRRRLDDTSLHGHALSQVCRQTRADAEPIYLEVGCFCGVDKVKAIEETAEEKAAEEMEDQKIRGLHGVIMSSSTEEGKVAPEREINEIYAKQSAVWKSRREAAKKFDRFPWTRFLSAEQQKKIRIIRFSIHFTFEELLDHSDPQPAAADSAITPPLSGFTGVKTVFVDWEKALWLLPKRVWMEESVKMITSWLDRENVDIIFEHRKEVSTGDEDKARFPGISLLYRFSVVRWRDGKFVKFDWDSPLDDASVLQGEPEELPEFTADNIDDGEDHTLAGNV